jgi:HlyD family secretion protein
MKRVLTFLALALAGGAVYLGFFRRTDNGSDFSGPGTVEAAEAALGFQSVGRIVFIGPREGDSVKKGQELARLDRDELEARRTQAQWHLAAERAVLEDIESGRARGTAPPAAAQRGIIAKAEAALRQADSDLRNAAIKAPFDGVVTVRARDPGAIVTAGAPVLSIVDLSDRWIRIFIAADQIGSVRIGQLATIKSDEHPDKTYGGTVSFIANQGESIPRTAQAAEEPAKLVYAVKVRITGDATADLKPGMAANVRLVTNSQ